MRTIRTKVYRFTELSLTAQKKAIEENRDINVHDDWYKLVYEDFKGLDDNGFSVEKIYFSGFCSQGDGAMFEGYVTVPTTMMYYTENTHHHAIGVYFAKD